MQAAGRCAASSQAFTVTPATAATQATQTSRTYTVTGLTVGTPVTIALVDSAQITAGTFALAAGNRLADLTFTPNVGDIAIDQINGVTVGAATSLQFTPTLTSITFRVDSLSVNASEAVPVVFKDNTAHTLLVNLDGVPTTQAFGIGGMVTFTPAAATPPAEAVSGAITGPVAHVYGSPATGFNTGAMTTQYLMRAGDLYQFHGTGITMAAFQSILSVGDGISGTYVHGSTVATPSTFNITTDLAFTAVAPVATSVASVVTVTYTPDSSISANGTTVTLQRAPVVSGVTGAYATVKTGTISTLSEQTFTETLADGHYSYRLIYTAPAFSGLTATSAVGLVTVDSTVANNQPTIERVYLTSNASAIATLSSGDVFKVVTDAPMVQPLVNATLTVGGSVLTNSAATATAAGSATFTVNTAAEVVDGVSHAAGTVLTVTLLADMAGGNVAFPTTVDASFGIANAIGQLTGFGPNSTLTQDVVS